MTDTSKAPVDQAAGKASPPRPRPARRPAGNGQVAPPRDAAPGGFGGLTMIKDKVAGVVRKLTGGS